MRLIKQERRRHAQPFQADVISREALKQAAAVLKHGKELASILAMHRID